MKNVSLSRGCIVCALAFIVGTALYAIFSAVWVLALGAALFFFIGGYFRQQFVWAGIWCVFLFLGGALYAQALSYETDHGLRALFETEVSFTGRVVREPEVRNGSLILVVLPDGDASSQILTRTSLFKNISYGERVLVLGVLQEPPVFEDFNYKAFLAKDGIHGMVRGAKISSVWDGAYEHGGQAFMARLFWWKNKMRETLSRIPPPSSELLGAMLLGDSQNMSDELQDVLSKSGLRHITAISGMHVAMLSGGALAFFLMLGMWRRQAVLFSLLFLVLFVLMAGAPASAVRAGIMGGAMLMGQIIGRPSASWRFLVYAAALMLAFNPLLLLRDIGFQLSFVAVAGILSFAPTILRFSEKIPVPEFIRQVMAVSLAAYGSTAPLLLFHFSFLSLSSLLANIIAVPLLPFILGIGVAFLLLGSLWGVLGTILLVPLLFLLSLLHTIASITSLVPGLVLEGAVSVAVSTLLALFVIFLAVFFKQNTARTHSKLFW